MTAEVPVSPQELDDIIFRVARDFLESKAVLGQIEELNDQLTQETVDDVVFIINQYMIHVNQVMSANSLKVSEQISTN
jgi:hypothetical protein